MDLSIVDHFTIRLLGVVQPYLFKDGRMCTHLIKYEDKYYLKNPKEHKELCERKDSNE